MYVFPEKCAHLYPFNDKASIGSHVGRKLTMMKDSTKRRKKAVYDQAKAEQNAQKDTCRKRKADKKTSPDDSNTSKKRKDSSTSDDDEKDEEKSLESENEEDNGISEEDND